MYAPYPLYGSLTGAIENPDPVSLGILNMPIIVLIHICLSPGTSWSNENSPICLMRNAKRKRKEKERKIPRWEWNSAPCPPFHRKWRDELMYLLNPSGLTGLEPAASALTGRCSDRLNYNPRKMRCTASKFFFFFSSFELLTFAVL